MESKIDKIIRIVVIVIAIISIVVAVISGTVSVLGYCLGWLCAAIWASIGLFSPPNK